MNICLFTENYYKGGLDTFVINLINAWPDQKDNITLICNKNHPGLETIINKIKRNYFIKTYTGRGGVKFTRKDNLNKFILKNKILRKIYIFCVNLFDYIFVFNWSVIKLAIKFRISSFDRLMVVNGGYPGSLICRAALVAWWLSGKKPLGILNFHNTVIPSPCYYAPFEYIIDILVHYSSSKIISVSQNCLESINCRKVFLNSKKEKIYIHNGIEDPKIYLDEKGNTSKVYIRKTCIMLATYETRKGHEYLFKAFRMVLKDFPDVNLLIYGHGNENEKKYVQQLANEYQLSHNISLNNYEENVFELLVNANILLVPSQKFESFGLTVIEAMSLGVPIVSTDVGGLSEVLGESKAGFICSKDSPHEFALAITVILRNPDLASNLGNSGRKLFINKYLATTMSKKYAEFINVKN